MPSGTFSKVNRETVSVRSVTPRTTTVTVAVSTPSAMVTSSGTGMV